MTTFLRQQYSVVTTFCGLCVCVLMRFFPHGVCMHAMQGGPGSVSILLTTMPPPTNCVHRSVHDELEELMMCAASTQGCASPRT